MTRDVAAIARGLTKGERDCITEDRGHLEGSTSVLLALALSYLADVAKSGAVTLTPLGLAVRQHLAEQEGRS